MRLLGNLALKAGDDAIAIIKSIGAVLAAALKQQIHRFFHQALHRSVFLDRDDTELLEGGGT